MRGVFEARRRNGVREEDSTPREVASATLTPPWASLSGGVAAPLVCAEVFFWKVFRTFFGELERKIEAWRSRTARVGEEGGVVLVVAEDEPCGGIELRAQL